MTGTIALLVMTCVSFVLVGCATTGPIPLANSFLVTLLSDKQIRSDYGPSFNNNPFLPPQGGLFSSKGEDYVVLKLSLATTSAVAVSLSGATASDEKGKVRAVYYDADKFRNLTLMLSPPPMDNTTKLDKIAWFYLPSTTVQLRPGSYSYVIVLVGPHPIPDNVTAHVNLVVGGNAMNFDLPVPSSEDS